MERKMRLTISSFCRQSEMLILCCSANFRSSPTCTPTLYHVNAPPGAARIVRRCVCVCVCVFRA